MYFLFYLPPSLWNCKIMNKRKYGAILDDNIKYYWHPSPLKMLGYLAKSCGKYYTLMQYAWKLLPPLSMSKFHTEWSFLLHWFWIETKPNLGVNFRRGKIVWRCKVAKITQIKNKLAYSRSYYSFQSALMKYSMVPGWEGGGGWGFRIEMFYACSLRDM